MLELAVPVDLHQIAGAEAPDRVRLGIALLETSFAVISAGVPRTHSMSYFGYLASKAFS